MCSRVNINTDCFVIAAGRGRLLHRKTRIRPFGGGQRRLYAVARSVFAGPLSHSQVVAAVRSGRQCQRPRRHTVSIVHILIPTKRVMLMDGTRHNESATPRSTFSNEGISFA